MKKLFITLVFMGFLFLFSIQSLQADIGPKATAEIEIIGVEGDYWFELLVPVRGSFDGTPPEYWEDSIQYHYYREDYPMRLLSFQDDDGFAACTFYYGPPCVFRQTDEHMYKMTYFNAPTRFKVAIVTEDDVLIVSEVIDRKLFQASFTFDLTGVDLSEDAFDVGTLEEHVPTRGIAVSFLLRVAITIALELGVLALFMYRKKTSYQLVGVVNLISQTLLTIGVLAGYYYFSIFGALAIFMIGEIFVFSFEIIVYALKLKEKGSKRAVIYALVANALTFAATFGFILLEPHLVS